jgi:SAM-dependent methyltransferase
VTAACPACGGALARAAAIRKGYAMVRCARCGLSRIDPIPNAAALADYYSRVYALAADTARVDVAAYARQGAQIARAFERWAAGARRVCEVGCAGGWVLKELERRGYTVKGYELSAATSRLARDTLGLDVVTGEFTPHGEPFDIVLMRHVLEHTRDPLAQIEAAAARLADGGTLFIAAPNGAGASSRLLGQYWSWYIPPAHIWYFTPASLRALVERAGLQTRWVETRQGDANNPLVEIAAGVARRLRGTGRGGPPAAAPGEAREALANRGPHRGLVAAANTILAPVSFAVSAVGLGDELWIAATKTARDVRAAS